MRLIGNSINKNYLATIVRKVDHSRLQRIEAAVAYTTTIDELAELARSTSVPFILYTLADGEFPNAGVVEKFLRAPLHWQIFLTRGFFHSKVIWLHGIGAYVGSANLTEQGWWRNIECGLWFDDDELEDQGLDDELREFFAGLNDGRRFVQANEGHLTAIRSCVPMAGQLRSASEAFGKHIDRALSGIPGSDPPPLHDATDRADGARQRFVIEWNNTLTILAKLTDKVRTVPWPAWVDPAAAPSIVQDQATEYWWDRHCRHGGESPADKLMQRYHEQNRLAPEAAVERVFAEWALFDANSTWADFVNVKPLESRRLLERSALARTTAAELAIIIENTHSAREHALRARKDDLGDHGRLSTQEERCRLLADLWLRSRTAAGRTVHEVLDYVLWDDAAEPEVAVRLWRGAHDPDWKIRRLGLSMLGELVGFARPDKFPPRNHRVSKTLHALGFVGIHV